MKIYSHYKIDKEKKKIEIFSPFSQYVVSKCKSLGGQWKGSKWEVAITRLEEIKKELGDINADNVIVEIAKEQIEVWANTYYLGFYVIANRRSRDGAVTLYSELVQGELPSSGGSIKNPCVAASEDSIFQFVCKKDFAEAQKLKIIETLENEKGDSKLNDKKIAEQLIVINNDINDDLERYKNAIKLVMLLLDEKYPKATKELKYIFNI